MYCFYFALEKPQINNTDDTFLKWIERNSESEKAGAMDSNKLANVRRYVMKEKNLCDAAPNEYKNRHDRVGQYLHWKICKEYSIDTNPNW